MDAVIKQKALVLAVNAYNFKSEDGKDMSGVAMEYLLTDDLSPRSDGNAKGIKTGKDSLPLEKESKFNLVPGMYNLCFEMRSGANRKMQLKAVDAEFISMVKLETEETPERRQP